MWEVIDLQISSPLSQPKRAKRELQEILRKYKFDDDFIESINEDTLKGFDAAINIVKDIVSDKIHK